MNIKRKGEKEMRRIKNKGKEMRKRGRREKEVTGCG